MSGSVVHGALFDLPLRDPPGVLERIVARTRADVAVRAQQRPLERLIDDVAASPHGVRDALAALRCEGLALIAEVKPRSPSRGPIRPGLDSRAVAAAYRPYAAMVSVLCDEPFFGGGHALLGRIRAAVDQPVLCKDFLVSRYQVVEARAAGADAVLLMASLLPPATLLVLLDLARSLGMAALVEVHDTRELAEVIATPARLIGVNSRNLRTMAIDREAAAALIATIPSDRIRVAESGIETRADVDRLAGVADAVLIGSTLMAAADPAQAIEALGWEASR